MLKQKLWEEKVNADVVVLRDKDNQEKYGEQVLRLIYPHQQHEQVQHGNQNHLHPMNRQMVEGSHSHAYAQPQPQNDYLSGSVSPGGGSAYGVGYGVVRRY